MDSESRKDPAGIPGSVSSRLIVPTGSFFPTRLHGGPPLSQFALTAGLARAGMRLLVLTRSSGVDDPRVVPDREISPFGVPTRYVSGSMWLRFLPRIFLELALADRSETIVQLVGCFAPESILCAVLCPLLGIPFVVSPRGELGDSALARKAYKKRPALVFLRPFYRRSAAVLVTCEAEADQYREHMGAHPRIWNIPNGLAAEAPPPPAPARPAIRPRLDGPYILCLGRILALKGVDRLIDAMRSIPGAVRLIIAGPETDPAYVGQLRDQVKSLGLESRVAFIGEIGGFTKDEILREAEAVVMPSHGENFGMVVIEALAQGTPVVASRGSPWEVLVRRDCGYWVSNDPRSLADAINACLRLDPEARARMSERGRALFAEEFSTEVLAPRYLAMYRSVEARSREDRQRGSRP